MVQVPEVRRDLLARVDVQVLVVRQQRELTPVGRPAGGCLFLTMLKLAVNDQRNQIGRHRRRRNRRLDDAPPRSRGCWARACRSRWSSPPRSASSASARRRSPRSRHSTGMIKIDEDDFLRAHAGHVQARHRVRGLVGEGASAYMHAFGPVGPRPRVHPVPSLFSQGSGCATRRRPAGSLWDYSFNWLAAKQARFARAREDSRHAAGGTRLGVPFRRLAVRGLSIAPRAGHGRAADRCEDRRPRCSPPTATCARCKLEPTAASSRRTSSSTAPDFAAC